MRKIAPLIAAGLLIAIGAVEASVSAQQLADSSGRPRLDSAGVMLSAAGLLARKAVEKGLKVTFFGGLITCSLLPNVHFPVK